MYAALARAVIDESDRGSVAAQIERMRRRHPRASRDELASRLIRSTALQCGAAGLAWSGPAAFFGSMPPGPDLAFQIAAVNRMVLGLAAIYRREGSGRERAAGIVTGLSAGLAADLLRRGVVTVLARSLPRRPGLRAAVGGLAGGALAYGTVMAVGTLALETLRRRGGFLRARRSG
jgi:hypothetical protein